jgi:hypothetical protein
MAGPKVQTGAIIDNYAILGTKDLMAEKGGQLSSKESLLEGISLAQDTTVAPTSDMRNYRRNSEIVAMEAKKPRRDPIESLYNKART